MTEFYSNCERYRSDLGYRSEVRALWTCLTVIGMAAEVPQKSPKNRKNTLKLREILPNFS